MADRYDLRYVPVAYLAGWKPYDLHHIAHDTALYETHRAQQYYNNKRMVYIDDLDRRLSEV